MPESAQNIEPIHEAKNLFEVEQLLKAELPELKEVIVGVIHRLGKYMTPGMTLPDSEKVDDRLFKHLLETTETSRTEWLAMTKLSPEIVEEINSEIDRLVAIQDVQLQPRLSGERLESYQSSRLKRLVLEGETAHMVRVEEKAQVA